MVSIWPAWVLLSAVLLWANIPGPQDVTVIRGRDVRATQTDPESRIPLNDLTAITWRQAWHQPLDLLVCPRLGWGCRYLTVGHRTLVAHVWKVDAIADLRAHRGDSKKLLTAVDGLSLRSRSLLFADFSESRLYAADLRGADLRGALLEFAALQGADLTLADMRGADLYRANMQGAKLFGAHMQGTRMFEVRMQGANLRSAQVQGAALADARLEGADLSFTEMQGADIDRANLEGAILSSAHLEGAYLVGANMRGADLGHAEMQGAVLSSAQMQGADLSWAQMQGADLSWAQMQGADLSWAQMQGANFDATNMQGADMRSASFWHANFGSPQDVAHEGYATVTLADMRQANAVTPLDDTSRAHILKLLDRIPDPGARDAARRRFDQALGPMRAPGPIFFRGDAGSVLVSESLEVNLAGVDKALFTLDLPYGPRYNPYDRALAAFLADHVAVLDSAVTHGLARRVLKDLGSLPTPWALEVTVWPYSVAIGCRLLADAASGEVSFAGYEGDMAELEKKLSPCAPTAVRHQSAR